MADLALQLARLPYWTITGQAKGLADGLEGYLAGRWDISLEGVLSGLRHIERISERAALGEPQATRPNPPVSPELSPSRP